MYKLVNFKHGVFFDRELLGKAHESKRLLQSGEVAQITLEFA